MKMGADREEWQGSGGRRTGEGGGKSKVQPECSGAACEWQSGWRRGLPTGKEGACLMADDWRPVGWTSGRQMGGASG